MSAARAANLEAGGEAPTTFTKRVDAVPRDLDPSAGNPKRVSTQTTDRAPLSGGGVVFSEAHALYEHDELPATDYPPAIAVKAAVDSGAKTIGFTIGNQYVTGTQLVGDVAFDHAVKKGVLVIPGVGDNAEEGNKPQFPAAYRHVAGVSAADGTGTVSKSSRSAALVWSAPASASSQPAENASGGETSAVGGGGFAVLRARRAG
ncbi:hypothetical protein ACFYNZ_32715 [Streptomyces kebangsaanensis]|uniref:Peptidase S8/S53 domain-containing protein n=1 Tax=Streptomyces kebangsaanensis TaxID=864058 RepID=A0ABW6L242_9ACTN